MPEVSTVTTRLTLHGRVAGLRGWGQATPPKWPVRIELRDPGLLAVVRLRSFRSQEVSVHTITQIDLGVNTVQFSRGGGFSGGGFGIRGAVTGMAMAGALNAMSRSRWEETYLHVNESLPSGAVRSVTFSLPTHTPASLLDLLGPAIDAWSGEWVRATLAGEIQPFLEPENLSSVYSQIDAVLGRQLIGAEQARTLSAHYSRPLLAELHGRLLARQVVHEEAEQTSAELARLLADRRITERQAQPLRELLQQIPAPGIQAHDHGQRETLIAELVELRRIGAITEHELQTEVSRLRHA